ncbi:MAG: M13 family metallopeptidase, partial [Candidatus Heimdallarchaeota archaeon]
MDTTVRPGDNFYRFANGNWINTTEIPANRPDYWMGTLLYMKSMENFQKIINNSQNTSKESSLEALLIGALYGSYIDTTKRESVGITSLQSEFEKIDAIENSESLVAYFAYAAKQATTFPIQYMVNEDLMNPQVYSLYIQQSGLTLPNNEYYLNSDSASEELMGNYQEHIENMLGLAGIDCNNDCIDNILNLEKSLASFHDSKEESRDYQKQYNPFTIDSLNARFSNLNWTAFFDELRVPNLENVIIQQPGFISGLNELIVSTPLDSWKPYLKWHMLHKYANYLDADIGNENFQFYSNKLEGIPEQSPLQERASNVINEFLGDAIGKLYVNEHFAPDTKEKMDALVSNVKVAFRKRIEAATWMSDETRTRAINKLSKMQAQIGYPPKWNDFSDVQLKKEDLFGNIKALQLNRHQELMKKIGESTKNSEWWVPPHLPNAYYNQNRNEVIFTAAILQPPLFNLDVDEAVVYGVVGGLIGHEITHGFDDEGGDFDETGALNNWWSESTQTEFNKRSKVLAEQYNAFTVLDSLHINGEFTLGENISDLGSLNIALEAYKLSFDGKKPIVLDGFTGLQRVFLGYAQI